jgi:hypothetical protein
MRSRLLILDTTLDHGTAIPREVAYNVPVFVLLMLACVLTLFVYLLYYKKTLQLVQGVFSYSSSRQLQREGYSFFKFFSLSLTGVYVICAGIFFEYLNEKGQWFSLPNERLVLPVSVAFLGGVLILKKLSVEVLALVLKNKKALSDYFFQYSFSIKTQGLLLLPVCLLLYYSAVPQAYLVGAGLAVPALVFLMRMVRVIAWGRAEYGVSVFHIVLYLCTVEIIPLAVFIKLLAAGWLQFG